MVPQTVRRVAAGLIVACYNIACEIILKGPSELGGTIWISSPFVLPLAVVLFSGKVHLQDFFLVLLAGLAVFGVVGLVWSLASPHDDFRFIGLILIPVYQFAILVAVTGAAGIIVWLRRRQRL